MQGEYAHIYKEIYDGADGTIADRIRAAMRKHGITIQYSSFERLYYGWRKYHNLHNSPNVKVVKVEQQTKAGGQLQSLKQNLNVFDTMVNELKPQHNQYGLPESLESTYKPYKLPSNHNDILLLNDIHVPYHNIEALTAALRYGLENNVNTILLNGDIIDFYAISRFEKDPRKRNFGHEVLMTREFLQSLRRLFPNAAIYYKCGNHDVRYDHYIMRNAPDLLGMNEFSFTSLMKLDEYNIEFIPDKQIIHAGKLTILHGHELGMSVFSPVNIARGLYLRAKDSALCGHHHQASEHSEPNINGKLTTCWSVACLCELHPDYMPINKHHHGFAHIKVLDNEDFEVNNYRIINGKIR